MRNGIEPGKHVRLLTVHQGMGLGHIIDIGRGALHGMHQVRLSIHATMALHAVVPLVALLGLMHLRVALAGAVLGRTGRGNQRGIDHRTALEQQALGRQRGVDRPQYVDAELVSFEQVTKPQDAHAIRKALGAREASEVAVQRRLEQGFFHG
jgi:hypothetical protein